jgi:pyrimidine-nucleoside phosphorylase
MDEHRMHRCIERKRDGGELSADDWHGIIGAFMEGAVDESQIAALCMACVWRGMSVEETYAVTEAMVSSGATITFDPNRGTVVDKHSSGGVGDIVSLAAVPLAAACGAHVAKLAGRALGHTGGTIDKLEAIPGFNATLSIEQFTQQVERVGCAIAAQSDAIVPADKRIYRLRDRTATIPELGLLASSIVSKKIAGGAHAFVFDVKAGAAAFMQDPAKAHQLAARLLELVARFGRRAIAFVTDMSEPLGRSIGTGLEVIEARDLLRGAGEGRALELIVRIAEAMVEECGLTDAPARCARALADGTAYTKFIEMVRAQHGDCAALESMHPGNGLEIRANSSGYVQAMDVVRLGHTARRLCARDSMGGLRMTARIGDRVEKGQALAHAFGRSREEAAHLGQAFAIGPAAVEPAPLIYERSISAIK